MNASSALLEDSFLGAVLTSFADVCVVISADGLVVSALAKSETFSPDLCASWVGTPLANQLGAASARRLTEKLEALSHSPANSPRRPAAWLELIHELGPNQTVPIRYALHKMPNENKFLLAGEDQRSIMEIQQQLLNAQIALERDYEAQREIDTRYRILMDFTDEAVALVAIGSGAIVDINHGAAQLLGYSRSDMINQPLSRFFKGFSRESLLAVIDNGNHSSASDIRSFETRNTQRSLQLTGKIFRASGEQLAMLRLSDTVEGTVGDGQLISGLRQLFLKGVDAIVFTDRDGTILAAGETFLNLTDFPANSAIKGRSVAEFLGRGTVDLRVLLDNARRAGQLRMYATKIKTDFGTQLPVEISATWLDDQFEPVMALVFRNATNASTVRVDQSAAPDSNMSNIVELVGSSTLKDIVSETTDVIEKICIETAIELTRNNRVAAAEMLGLSRQSLYVKLRKYGMLSKDDD